MSCFSLEVGAGEGDKAGVQLGSGQSLLERGVGQDGQGAHVVDAGGVHDGLGGKDIGALPDADLAGVDELVLGLHIVHDQGTGIAGLLKVLKGVEAGEPGGIGDKAGALERDVLILVENVAEVGVVIDDPFGLEWHFGGFEHFHD